MVPVKVTCNRTLIAYFCYLRLRADPVTLQLYLQTCETSLAADLKLPFFPFAVCRSNRSQYEEAVSNQLWILQQFQLQAAAESDWNKCSEAACGGVPRIGRVFIALCRRTGKPYFAAELSHVTFTPAWSYLRISTNDILISQSTHFSYCTVF